MPADIFIIAVPTPFKEGREPNLSYIAAATRAIAPCVQKGNLVILGSTSPPGTTEEVVGAELAAVGHNVGEDVFVAHCPEHLLPDAS